MRKVMIASLLLGLLVSSGFAFQSGTLPLGVGGKYAALGGAGSAIVDDIACAYFNPAGIVKAGNMELKIGAGSATEGLNDLLNVVGKATTPAKFLSDNFNKTLNINGSVNALVGLNVAKIGISVIPVGNLTLTKATGTLVGVAAANLNYEGILTLGYGLSTPGLPFASLDLGANIKSANAISATSAGAIAGTGFTTTDNVTNRTGIGYDIGVTANLNTLVVPVSVAIVMKDISETLKGKVATTVTTYDATGTQTSQSKSEIDAADLTMPTTTVIGASTTIPGVGLKVAIDLDSVSGSGASYSLTHIGVEYPLMGLITLRAGTVAGANDAVSQTTLGAGINLGLGINVTTMTDAKNSKNNSTIIDLGFAF